MKEINLYEMRYSKPFEQFLSNLLSIFALINILMLYFYGQLINLELFNFINPIYTFIVLSILILSYIYSVIDNKVSLDVLRRCLPDLIIIVIALLFRREPIVFQLLLIGRQLYLLINTFVKRHKTTKKYLSQPNNAAIFVLLSFLATILIGTVLLLLPISTAEGNTTSFIGALFTATSATCVTGLIVYNTGTHFTTFGHTIILLLFQIGGLGIMTISTSFAILTGQRLSLRGESIMQNVIEETNRLDMVKLIKNIILVTLIFELIGSASLYSAFYSQYIDTSNAIFSSLFHSVSAFCNAGFSLYPDSFITFRGHWVLNLTVAALIIFGGIGFSVLVDLKKNLFEKYRPIRFSLHTKLVLLVTLFFIILGSLLFFITEYNHSMDGFPLRDRFLASFFQSVTTRTAGFNTVDTAKYSNSSAFFSLFMMFVGASPGSTGGGIKTTSFAIIILSVLAIFFGNKDVIIFKRKIHDSLIRRVMALIAVSLTLLFIVIVLLMMIEPFSFVHIIFEAFSAFGTVGLSMGITPYLSDMGRILIIILMYFGRVGPLTLIFALSRRELQTSFVYAEEKVSVG